MRRYPIKAGRFLSNGDTQSAVITQSLADELGLKLGDKIGLPTTEGNVNLKIVGLLPARAIPGNEEVLVTLLEAQSLLNLPTRINTIELNLEPTDAAQKELIVEDIKVVLGNDYTLGAITSGSELMASMKMGRWLLRYSVSCPCSWADLLSSILSAPLWRNGGMILVCCAPLALTGKRSSG